ncbi:cupin domain-containing protein [Hydrogenophaga sp.]|uniref:cupin domain-containing protein n=1 Tax=Hydrogenophaga sp. TaxID=1904254 RepID=UPI00286D7C8F|nr:cupin domain-containing protein [Hydrogenophaga sp.]
MKVRYIPLAALLLLGAHLPGHTQDNPLPAGFTTQPLLKTGMTRDNEPIRYPTAGAEMISVIGTLEKDGRTPLHMHPVPVYVYVMEGEIELRTDGSAPQRYKAGQAFIESQNRRHQAFNVAAGGPSRLLVVFVGEAGKPTTVAGN